MILNYDKEIDTRRIQWSTATAIRTYLSSNIADPSSNNSSTEPKEAELPLSFPTELCDLLEKSDFNLF